MCMLWVQSADARERLLSVDTREPFRSVVFMSDTDALSERKTISPWTQTVGHGTHSAVELDLSTASTVVREEMFTLQVNTVEEL